MNTETVLSVASIAAVIFTVGAVTSCNVANTSKRAEAAVAMQAKGADPLDIPCAIGDGTERYCELRAASRGPKP
jgi:hypothetical protein